MSKRKMIYDEEALAASEEKKETAETKRLNRKATKVSNTQREISVADAISAFVGYSNPVFDFVKYNGGSECILCGEHTLSTQRTLCAKCMQNNGMKIYKAIRDSLGDQKITF